MMLSNDPQQDLIYDMEANVMKFRKQVIAQNSIEWMIDSFMKNDFKKLGFLFGETLDKLNA